MDRTTTLGVVVGHRGFFPAHLVEEGRTLMASVLENEGFRTVALGPGQGSLGAVETRADTKQCAELFSKHRGEIDGIVVTLPNFGDERAIADTIRMADLDVPVLVHAYPDDSERMALGARRDSFCGKISVCNNLRQYGIRFSLTRRHTVRPDCPDFRMDIQWFGEVCRVVAGLKSLRIGAIGARPGAFKTVRFSEKLLELAGISVETIDLSEILGRAGRVPQDSREVREKMEAISACGDTSDVPGDALTRMATFAVAVEGWMGENELAASAIQCWTSIQENFGISPCAVMSSMSNCLLPSACEVDICGAISMYALQEASRRPSALADWNNSYGDEMDKAVLFHCGNWPSSLVGGAKVGCHDILGGILGPDRSYGTCAGRAEAGPFTYARVSTDDVSGTIRAYVGEGMLTEDPLDTFGNRGVVEVPEMQELMQFVCEEGFEHHVAINPSSTAGALCHAFENYLGWQTYHHEPE